MSIDECILAYKDVMKAIFGDETLDFPAIIQEKPRRDRTQRLENAFKDILVKSNMRETELLNDGESRQCRT
jgi:hypothetical protein